MGLFDTILTNVNSGIGQLGTSTSGTRLFSSNMPSNNYRNNGALPNDLTAKDIQAMSLGDAYDLAFKMNPWGVSLGLGKGLFDTGSSIWNAFQNYKSYKDQLALSRDMYNLKKQEYENNEARNQQQFDWWKQARATSQL